MERKLRRCSVCGSEYRFCNRCPEDRNKPNWYFAFCSNNCKDIYDITSKFENGQIINFEAKSQLKKLDLSRLANFGTSYKASIDKIMKASSVSITKKEFKNNIVNDTETDENNNSETKEQVKSIKKAKTTKVRNDVE